MRRLLDALRRPFPDRPAGRAHLLGLARTAVFVTVFLYVFRPFVNNTPVNYLVICLGYGAVTFVVAAIYHYATERLLGWERSGPSWTLARWIADCGGLLFFIALGNFVYYNALVGWTAFHPYVLLGIALPTVLVGLFPIAFSGMAIQLRAERTNQLAAHQLRHRPRGYRPAAAAPPVSLTEDFSLSPDQLLFAESRQNYVRFVYGMPDEPVRERTVRLTLSAAESALSAPDLLRCHRSYLVNVARVTAVEGNAQGLRLTLDDWPEPVPVSRSYVEKLRAAVN